jgi:antitoxin PrlF
MPSIHEIATITSKGQITLPKPIRQALGVDYGGKVAFDLRGTQVVVTRADEPPHEDPAITGFLALLEGGIQSGRQITSLPDDVVRAMLATLVHPANLTDEIKGDVAL